MGVKDSQKRLRTAYKLFTEETTSREKLTSIYVLVKGINPRLDHLLVSTSKILSDVEKFQKGDVILLTAENLPENTPDDKKRKKILLTFIHSWRQLKSEIKRLENEYASLKDEKITPTEKIRGISKILATLKGPFGAVTFIALLVVAVMIAYGVHKKSEVLSESAVAPSKITKVVIYNESKIPLSELFITNGSNLDCDSDHYHAANHSEVEDLDGHAVFDPGFCGFGKVDETKVIEVEI